MTRTIREQFETVCNNGGVGDIVCPQCRKELRQHEDDGAYLFIERGECPMCNCVDRAGVYQWCPECSQNADCHGYQETLAEKAEFEYYEAKRHDAVYDEWKRLNEVA